MQELIDIIEEEAEIMEPTTRTEQLTQDALYSAVKKIHWNGSATKLEPAEKKAVKYALQDVGELYLLTGTSAGFDVETTTEEVEHRNRGRLAREQAAALGISL